MVRPVFLTAGLSFSMSILSLGCSQGGKNGSGGSSGDGAPTPPSPFSLSMDLSVIDGGLNLDEQASHLVSSELWGDGASNHLQAASIIGVVNSSLASFLAVPVALLHAGQSAAASQMAEGTWVHSYDAAAGGKNWTVNLESQAEAGGSTNWTLQVTGDCCKDFVLVSGSVEEQTHGQWQLFDTTQVKQTAPLAMVKYDVTGADQRKLAFTIGTVRPSTFRFGGGSSLTYEVNGDNVTMTYQDSTEIGSHTLTWSRTSQAGSHTDTSGRRLCWDSRAHDFANVACP